MRDGDRIDRERLDRDFFLEAEEIFEALTESLRALEEACREGRPRPALINTIFREVHSLKGLAGLQGLQEIVDLAHGLEDLLELLRLGRGELTGPRLDLIQEAFDALVTMVRGLAAASGPVVDRSGLRERLRAEASAASGLDSPEARRVLPGLDPRIAAALSEYEEHRLAEVARAGTGLFVVRLRLEPQEFDARLRAIVQSLEAAGAEVICTVPTFGDEADSALLFSLVVASEAGRPSVARALHGHAAEVAPLGSGEVGAPDATAPAVAVDEPGEDLKGVSESIRVPIARLDEVLAQVGELTIALASVGRAAQRAFEARPDDRDVRELGREIRALLPRLRALQRGTIEARLVPLEQVFGRVGRMVARAARAAGKEVELHTLGGETELDKAMMDQLASPLVHLLRNALDHGIEGPEERERAGKPRRSRLVLSAFQKGRAAVVDIIDDGRGIATASVRAAAEADGRIAPGQPISRAEAHELIFAPGLSTADRVSQASGRGVGLDVVRRTIRRLKGSIEVRSIEGKGTTFTVTVPITLALVQALIVRACGQRFAIPVAAIRENLRLEAARRRLVDAGEIYDHPLGPLPLLRLDHLLRTRPGSRAREEGRYAVVAGPPGKRFGIVVDGFVGQQEVVIKPIGRRLSDLPGLAGATDLGDATAVLVLDPEGLLAGAESDRVAV